MPLTAQVWYPPVVTPTHCEMLEGGVSWPRLVQSSVAPLRGTAGGGGGAAQAWSTGAMRERRGRTLHRTHQQVMARLSSTRQPCHVPDAISLAGSA